MAVVTIEQLAKLASETGAVLTLIEMHPVTLAALRKRWENPTQESPAMYGHVGYRGVPVREAEALLPGMVRVTRSDGSVELLGTPPPPVFRMELGQP